MEINCKFSFASVTSVDQYACYFTGAFIIEKDQVIKKLKGVHVKGKTNKDVKIVYFHQTKVNYFPRGFEKHFPNLTYLAINGGDIKDISKNDLKGLEGLFDVCIAKCELTSLPDDLFTEMPNLRSVSFADNKIEFASSKFLKPLIGRENVKVDLRRNKNIDACYWPGFQGSLGSLEELMRLIDEKCIKLAQPSFYIDPVVVEHLQPIPHPGFGVFNFLQPISHPGFDVFNFLQPIPHPGFGIVNPPQPIPHPDFGIFNPFQPVAHPGFGIFNPPQPIAHPGPSKLLQPVVHHVPVNINPKLKEMWISGKFSDLTIVAGEKEFKVHKNILGMENQIFAKIFEDQLEATEIKIPEFSSDSVGALLKFIYTNEATEDGNAKENFEIANKFEVVAMKSIYEKIICDQINEANAWDTFMFAHRLSSQLIKEKAFRQIVKKTPEELPDKLMEDPEKLKKLIDARRIYEEMIAESRK